MYDTGASMREIYLKRATYVFKKQAKAGHTYAEWELSNFFQGESYLPHPYERISPEPILLHKSCVDNKKALHWLRKAARSGFVSAAFELYRAYGWGKFGVDVDVKKAFKWCSVAASNGAESCQFRVACLYLGRCDAGFKSWGVEKDLEKGLRWLKRAARNGHKDPLNRMGQCYHYSLYIGAKNTVHLPCANEKNEGYYGENDEYKRVEEGEVSLWVPDEKTLVFTDPDMAIRCYVIAARAGSIEAMDHLGHIFSGDFISIKDEAAALMWKEKAKLAKEICAGGVTQNDYPIDYSPPASESDSESASELSFLEVPESDSEGPGSEEGESEEDESDEDESESGSERPLGNYEFDAELTEEDETEVGLGTCGDS